MRTIIPGPPGTGKTYHLINHYLMKEVEEYKTPTYKIAYITFSNAATNEALKRIGDLFPRLSVKKDFPNVKTMHKMGTRELGINTSEKLLKGSKWKAFKNFSKICSDISFEAGEYENGMPAYQGREMKIIEYARSKKIRLLESAIQLD